MHVVGASWAFNVSLLHQAHWPVRKVELPSTTQSHSLRTAARALLLLLQGMIFALLTWLLIAAPGVLSV